MFIFLIEEIYSLKLAFYSKCFSQILFVFIGKKSTNSVKKEARVEQ